MKYFVRLLLSYLIALAVGAVCLSGAYIVCSMSVGEHEARTYLELGADATTELLKITPYLGSLVGMLTDFLASGAADAGAVPTLALSEAAFGALFVCVVMIVGKLYNLMRRLLGFGGKVRIRKALCEWPAYLIMIGCAVLSALLLKAAFWHWLRGVSDIVLFIIMLVVVMGVACLTARLSDSGILSVAGNLLLACLNTALIFLTSQCASCLTHSYYMTTLERIVVVVTMVFCVLAVTILNSALFAKDGKIA